MNARLQERLQKLIKNLNGREIKEENTRQLLILIACLELGAADLDEEYDELDKLFKKYGNYEFNPDAIAKDLVFNLYLAWELNNECSYRLRKDLDIELSDLWDSVLKEDEI